MYDDLSPSKTPEEEELEKKRDELAGLESELADAELELATLQAELNAFEARYYRVVGVKYVQLDAILAEVAQREARRKPRDTKAQRAAAEAGAKAEQSAREAGIAEVEERPGAFEPSEQLKKLYREAAKQLHPDLATDAQERERRTPLMAEVNEAYRRGDGGTIERILSEWQVSPESVKGEGAGAELVRVIRKIRQVEGRLRAIEEALAELKESDLHCLTGEVLEAENEGRDLLEEMAAGVDAEIASARVTLAAIGWR